ncbi:uncharacterized protein LTR77_005786 [Saxophila tyrrhenica]|uniref:Uncharacterized protein n=1 Tax=Saxophila tyrrhenica TaxID=1690608 RepID=A0AAV9P9I9_9PEZI|nr:hypothetical protein LTR77_005786 [Saxophila tyrrhenica]
MPRDGSGASDNVVEPGETLIHGAGKGENDAPASSGVDRSNKAAPPPDHEAGDAMKGMNASGGGNDVKGSGKGPIESSVDKEAEKH